MSFGIDIYSTGTPSNEGELGYYNLLNWWYNDFSELERDYIQRKFKAIGSNGLTKGTILGSTSTSVNFLTNLQSWFTVLSDESISERLLTKAETLVTLATPVLDIHFLFTSFIEHYYKKRIIHNNYYELSKSYCMKQIEISPKARIAFLEMENCTFLPKHKGFMQLAIILEKEKKYAEAIKLCIQAKDAGWFGDWEKRINILQEKFNKQC